MDWLIIGIGGALGSLFRYGIGQIIAKKTKGAFPTFVINISGALLLGIVSTINAPHNIYLFLADGFLGAYTTFSTFMYEGVNLIKGNEKLNAILYITTSVILGILGYGIGVYFTQLFT